MHQGRHDSEDGTMSKIAIGTLILILVVILGLPVLGQLFGSSPEKVAREYLEACNSRDMERLKPLFGRGSDLAFWLEAARGPYEGYTVGDASVNGSSADVPVAITQQGEDGAMFLDMELEEGEWHINGMSGPYLGMSPW